jgi:hypothetical protein
MKWGQALRWILAILALRHQFVLVNMLHSIRLDYLSCVLTVLGTVLIGRKLWQGWLVAAINSVVVCIIGMRTAQFGLVPANLLCIALYASNLFAWRFNREALDPLSLIERGIDFLERRLRALANRVRIMLSQPIQRLKMRGCRGKIQPEFIRY